MVAVLLLLVFVQLCCSLPYKANIPVQVNPRAEPYKRGSSNSERAEAVKEAFQFAWNGYSSNCFGHDEIHPVSKTCGDSRNGWGASAVDALSTAIIMELSDVVEQILDYIPTIDFTKTDSPVSLFETTIRYLGGMLSAYDLLKGPFVDLVKKPDSVSALLTQCETLAQRLEFAFNTESGIPSNTLDFSKNTLDLDRTGSLATAGTLTLEWCRLADLTKNSTYCKLATTGEGHLLNPKNPDVAEPFPGLRGTNMNITTGEFVNSFGSWGASSDSYYEYLLKMWIYNPPRNGIYRDSWIRAADSTIQYLTSHPSSRPDLTFIAEWNSDKNLTLRGQHLTCFSGGNFLLGGSNLQRDYYTKFGLSLVDFCHEVYISTATHIGPEIFSWDAGKVPASRQSFYNETGYYTVSADYVLRPEVVESFYYAYRITGDSKYQDWAWDAFVAINSTCRAGVAFSTITDVDVVGGGKNLDNEESFFFAELMKYLYIINLDDADFQVMPGRTNKFVFNTEAHPIKVKRAMP